MSKKSTRPRTERAVGASVSTDADASASTAEEAGTGEKPGRGPAAAGTQQDQAPRRQDAFRETIESIVVAFILAFLFRTFEAEAFVIPTGSMAPTLLGRHKDILCDECGLSFRVGASSEVQSPYENSDSGYYNPFQRLQTAYCPNCRHEMPVEDLPPFKGDRILVNKFPYEMGQPDRWDVVVFKYPENPRTNYIKRLVGLPGETLEVRQGDLYRVGKSETAILRKDDPGKQLVLQQLVYDDAFPPHRMLEAGWPERWAPMRPADGAGNEGGGDAGPVPVDVAGWQTDGDGWVRDAKTREFQLAGERSSARRWLRYRHFVPDREDWEAVRNGLPVAGNPRPRLISDFCGYNAFTSPGERETPEGLFWVGDLTVRFRIGLGDAAEKSNLLLELNEGSRRYRCEIDLQSGHARLFHLADQQMEDAVDENDVKLLGEAETSLRGGKTADLIFANVDNRLVLWLDGDLVDFGEGAAYRARGDESMIQLPRPTDLIPVGIAVTGAEATVSRLRLERDVYYRADAAGPPASEEFRGSSGYLRAALSDPEEWGRRYLDGLTDPQTPGRRFELGDDEYFMLGDNSPRSKDSRLWGNTRHAVHRHAVPGTALVGKAFYIYWPHAIPFLNPNESGVARGWPQDGNSVLNNPLTRRFVYHKTSPEKYSDYPALRFPFYPNLGRMKRIRQYSSVRGRCSFTCFSRSWRMAEMSLLRCVGLVKDYPGKRAVDGVDFCVEPGEIVGLLGPNGAGKTTTFRMSCGLTAATDGRVFLKEKDVSSWPMYRRARVGMGFLPQDESVFGKLSVAQNLQAILEFLPLSRRERVSTIQNLLGRFGLADKQHQQAGTLSGGERRRLEIARCLASRPSLILLDEPFTGIDPRTIHDIQDIIRGLRDRGISILLTDHRERETLTITDRSYIICAGKVVVSGDARTVLADPTAQDLYFGKRFDAASIISGKQVFAQHHAARQNSESSETPSAAGSPPPPGAAPVPRQHAAGGPSRRPETPAGYPAPGQSMPRQGQPGPGHPVPGQARRPPGGPKPRDRAA